MKMRDQLSGGEGTNFDGIFTSKLGLGVMVLLQKHLCTESHLYSIMN